LRCDVFGWAAPRRDTKSKRGRVAPFDKILQEAIRALWEINGGHEFVFSFAEQSRQFRQVPRFVNFFKFGRHFNPPLVQPYYALIVLDKMSPFFAFSRHFSFN